MNSVFEQDKELVWNGLKTIDVKTRWHVELRLIRSFSSEKISANLRWKKYKRANELVKQVEKCSAIEASLAESEAVLLFFFHSYHPSLYRQELFPVPIKPVLPSKMASRMVGLTAANSSKMVSLLEYLTKQSTTKACSRFAGKSWFLARLARNFAIRSQRRIRDSRIGMPRGLIRRSWLLNGGFSKLGIAF